METFIVETSGRTIILQLRIKKNIEEEWLQYINELLAKTEKAADPDGIYVEMLKL